jgi:glycosyltransferase involved in cell wall biosynthesis
LWYGQPKESTAVSDREICRDKRMLTVLFSTRDGAAILPAVLTSYTGLKSPSGGWKLVIVDNGSVDRSRAIIDSFRGQLPLHCFSEPQPGKNMALNAALTYVDGDLVVLTDDDVFPRSDWLSQLRAAADAQQSYAVFGGKILPRWEVSPPQWLLTRVPVGPTFALTEASVTEGPTGAHNVFGPNMAVRASIFEGGARFSTSIGPRGRDYAMGSETEFVRRLLRQGHQAWHVRDAIVEHFIRKTQMSQRWILGRAVRFGRGQYRLSLVGQPSQTKSWRGVPRYLYRQLADEVALALKAACGFDGEALFHARWNLNYIRGQMIEAGLVHRHTPSEAAILPSRGRPP